MKRVLLALSLFSLSPFAQASMKAEFSSEDRTELARLQAELRAAEQQNAQAQEKIAQLRERISRHESAAHVRVANSDKKSYRGSQEEAYAN